MAKTKSGNRSANGTQKTDSHKELKNLENKQSQGAKKGARNLQSITTTQQKLREKKRKASHKLKDNRSLKRICRKRRI